MWPWNVQLECDFHEHTADIEDNQILTWTLLRIVRSGLCGGDVANSIRKAFRAMRSMTQLRPLGPAVCEGRQYNRLNMDYQPIHALCRFFLEHSGPQHKQGTGEMLPFLIDMSVLYEKFVAAWLREHLPEGLLLDEQLHIALGGEHKVEFRVDLVISDRSTGRPVCLMDTKYKAGGAPEPSDVQQVIAYAKALGCPEAMLVYPRHVEEPFDALVGGDIHVGTAAFRLDDDLEQCGQEFLGHIAKRVKLPASMYASP